MRTMSDWVKDVIKDYYDYSDVELEQFFSAEAIKCIKQSSSDDINETVLTIMAMDEAFARYYRFDYLKKTDTYNEYDGTIVNAPTEQFAWFIFLGMDIEYKIASAADYSCAEITKGRHGGTI